MRLATNINWTYSLNDKINPDNMRIVIYDYVHGSTLDKYPFEEAREIKRNWNMRLNSIGFASLAGMTDLVLTSKGNEAYPVLTDYNKIMRL